MMMVVVVVMIYQGQYEGSNCSGNMPKVTLVTNNGADFPLHTHYLVCTRPAPKIT